MNSSNEKIANSNDIQSIPEVNISICNLSDIEDNDKYGMLMENLMAENVRTIGDFVNTKFIKLHYKTFMD